MTDGWTQFFIPTHLLAVVAVGLLLGQGARHVSVQLAVFVLGLLAGSVAIAFAIRETPSALVLLAIAAIAGFIVVLAWALPWYLAALLAFVTGGAIALNSPPQALRLTGAIVQQIDTAFAATTVLAFAGLIAERATRPWQRIGVRVVGSWIAASAFLVLALRLAR